MRARQSGGLRIDPRPCSLPCGRTISAPLAAPTFLPPHPFLSSHEIIMQALKNVTTFLYSNRSPVRTLSPEMLFDNLPTSPLASHLLSPPLLRSLRCNGGNENP